MRPSLSRAALMATTASSLLAIGCVTVLAAAPCGHARTAASAPAPQAAPAGSGHLAPGPFVPLRSPTAPFVPPAAGGTVPGLPSVGGALAGEQPLASGTGAQVSGVARCAAVRVGFLIGADAAPGAGARAGADVAAGAGGAARDAVTVRPATAAPRPVTPAVDAVARTAPQGDAAEGGTALSCCPAGALPPATAPQAVPRRTASPQAPAV